MIAIRPAEPADYDTVARLTVDAYLALPGGHLSAAYEAELRDVARRAKEAEVLVAVDPADGTILGSVTNVPDGGPYGELAGPDEAEFRMLAVAPAAQGRGAGTALVRWCVEDARRRGRARVVLSTTAWMATAHRMYERLGFRRAPERDWQPVPEVRLLAYVLDLP